MGEEGRSNGQLFSYIDIESRWPAPLNCLSLRGQVNRYNPVGGVTELVRGPAKAGPGDTCCRVQGHGRWPFIFVPGPRNPATPERSSSFAEAS